MTENDRIKTRAAALSIASNTALIALKVFAGIVTGSVAIITEPRGSGGFGYDPAFVPDDYEDGRTMAELTPGEKHAISHRGRAAKAFAAWLESRR